MTQPIPDGFHTITPTFMFKDTRKAIEFYKKAFGIPRGFLCRVPMARESCTHRS